MTTLVGRSAETAVLDAALSDLARGVGGAVLVEGSPGVGRSALLDHAVRRARECGATVLRGVGAEPESALAFGALHQVLRPVLPLAEGLPPALGSALRRAFWLEGGAAPSGMRLGAAALELLRTAAASGPLVLGFDDAHWADPESREILGFLVRRAVAVPVLLVLTQRSGVDPSFTGARGIVLGPLRSAAAEQVLDARWPGLPRETRLRVLRGAAGNPLGLVELPAALAGPGLRSRTGDSARLPLTGRLRRSFAQQAAGLPAATATALLAAALNTGTAVFEALRAATLVVGRTVVLADLAPAVTAGLVELHGLTVEFAHPLTRSAVADRADLDVRHAVHAALADVLAGDPDREIWHRAALVGAGEDVASGLEQAAERALDRGAPAVALRAMMRSAELSTDRGTREARLIRSAELAVELGDPVTGSELLADVPGSSTPAAASVRLLLDQRWFAADRSSREGLSRLLAAADECARGGRPDLALRGLIPLADSAHPHVRRAVVAKVRELAAGDDDPSVLFVLGLHDTELSGARVIAEVRRVLADPGVDPLAARDYATTATVVGDFESALRALPGVAAALRAQNRLSAAAQALVSLSWAQAHCGDLVAAAVTATEGERLCAETGQPYWRGGAAAGLLWLLATRLDEPDFAAASRSTWHSLPRDSISPHVTAMLQRARGAASLAQARYTEAYEQLATDFEAGPAWRWWSFAEFAQAGVHAGHTAEVARLTAVLIRTATATGSPLLLRYSAFAAALLPTGDDRGERFRRGLRELRGDPFLAARLRSEYGGWLRRARRVRESRVVLHEARSALLGCAATRWVEQVDRELLAAGDKAGGGGRPVALTPQEAAVAALVATGLSNRDTAERLSISPRTVSTHLQRIFRKLGVLSRADLRDALDRGAQKVPG